MSFVSILYNSKLSNGWWLVKMAFIALCVRVVMARGRPEERRDTRTGRAGTRDANNDS